MADAPLQEYMWDDQKNMVDVWWAYFNELVTTGSSPIFLDVTIEGSTTIEGDTTIDGDLEVDNRDVLRYMYTVAAGS